jgi:hypothetical protein
MEVNYNKFTEQELQVILDAARTINYAFGTQFPSHKEQLALLIEDLHFRVINQIVIQTYNALRSKYIARGIDPDASDFVPDHLEK